MMQSTRWRKQMWAALKMVAPGTVLRDGIENILRAKTGGLIVLGDAPEVREITQGGFHIDEEITASVFMSWQKWMAPLFWMNPVR